MSVHQFVLYRIVWGGYLAVHFLYLLLRTITLPESVPDASAQTQSLVLDNFSVLSDYKPWVLYVALAVGAMLGGLLAFGVKRRFVASSASGIWLFLWWHDPSSFHPLVPCATFLVFLMAWVPTGEPFSFRQVPKSDWSPPERLYRYLFFLVVAGVSMLGGIVCLTMFRPGGAALQEVFSSEWLAGLVVRGRANLSFSVDWLMTWSGVWGACLALPLLFFSRARRWVWLFLLLFGMAACLRFNDLHAAALGFMSLIGFFDGHWIPPAKSRASNPVIYFDGVCVLCNGAVDFILAEDSSQIFHFASIQGERGKCVNDPAVQRGESMALQDGDRLYVRSDAVLQVARRLGGIWRVLSEVAVFVPQRFRDVAYNLVQKNRYSVFGKWDACRVPSPEEKTRFLP